MDENKKLTERRLFDSFNQFNKLYKLESPVKGVKKSEIFVLFGIQELLLGENKGVKVSQISDLLDVTPPTVTQLINSLEEKGYVERKMNKEDRRSVRVNLTEKSDLVIQQAMGEFVKYFEGLVNYLGEEQGNLLANLLAMVLTYTENYKKNLPEDHE